MKAMIKDAGYRGFSERIHRRIGQRQGACECQFELTFACGLRCLYCYSSCYNRPAYLRRQLPAAGARRVLDRLSEAGVVWLTFTGGDPLARGDFSELYAYAKKKGFVVQVFTNGFSMTPYIADLFAEQPPLRVEMTLNAVDPRLYDRISGVPGAFARTSRGIELMLERSLPLKVKTQVLSLNLGHLPRIKRFLEQRGLTFTANPLLFPALDRDPAALSYRIRPDQLHRFKGFSGCGKAERSVEREYLFECSLTRGMNLYVDPQGRLSLCQLLRYPSADLLREPLAAARHRLIAAARRRKVTSRDGCSSCTARSGCFNCPGRAYLETADAESRIPYYCRIAGRKEGG